MSIVTIDGYKLSESDVSELQATLSLGIRRTKKFLRLTQNETRVSPAYRETLAKRCEVVERIQEIIDEPNIGEPLR